VRRYVLRLEVRDAVIRSGMEDGAAEVVQAAS